jgi:aminopeptidase
MTEMKDMDAYIAVRGSHNISETSDVSADSMQLAMKKLRGVMDHRVKKTKWCVLRWPTPTMAQQANMSTEAFEDFFFKVCLLDYKALTPAMNALVRLMNKTDEVHITGPGTDLKSLSASLTDRLGRWTTLQLSASYSVFNSVLNAYRESAATATLSMRY